MMTNIDYVINRNTSAICSHFDNKGYEHSVILNSDGEEIHDQKSPTKIVDYSFKHKANGLQGAIDGARFILNKKQDVPVIYSLSNKIILLRVKTTDGRGTIVLVDSQILNTEPYSSNQTEVYLLNGKSILVGTKHHLLVNKRKDCAYLHSEAMKNKNFPNNIRNSIDDGELLLKQLKNRFNNKALFTEYIKLSIKREKRDEAPILF